MLRLGCCLKNFSRGGQKEEFRSLRRGLRKFFADAESKNFLCRRKRSGGGDRSFFLFFFIFLCKFETHGCFKFFLECFVEEWLYLYSIELFYCQRLVFASLVLHSVVYAKFNTTLDTETQAPRPTSVAAYNLLAFGNSHTVHVVLQSVQHFSEAVCRLQLNKTPICG